MVMVQGPLNPNITWLCEKLWPVTWKQKFTSVIQKYKLKNANKSQNLTVFSRRYKNCFLEVIYFSWFQKNPGKIE